MAQPYRSGNGPAGAGLERDRQRHSDAGLDRVAQVNDQRRRQSVHPGRHGRRLVGGQLDHPLQHRRQQKGRQQHPVRAAVPAGHFRPARQHRLPVRRSRLDLHGRVERRTAALQDVQVLAGWLSLAKVSLG